MAATIKSAGLLCAALVCGLSATGATHHTARKSAPAQPVPAQEPAPAPPVPQPPPVLEQQPATPPKVSMIGGQLSIVAANSTLGDILNAVKRVTGAGIDVPSAANYQRVVAQLGPGRPQQVLQQLLTGSKFDYIILGSADNPDAIQQIILTSRGAGAPGSSGSVAVNQPQPNPADRPLLNEPEPDPNAEEDVQQEPPQPEPVQQQPEPPQPQTEEPQQPGNQPNNPNNPNTPKTPEQLLQELQRLQQQGQAGRPQQ
ncbi:MAG TPA: hypothetical protein VMU28_10360 [Terriglobales bacterium]|nr:hypothetical protein [Terriglobales bacterium]